MTFHSSPFLTCSSRENEVAPGQKLVFLQFERKIQRGYRSMAKIVFFVINHLA